MTSEVEIKFQCPPKMIADLAQLSNLGPGYAVSPPYLSQIHDTYLDTNDGLLLNQGASLRCRKRGNQLRITFKSNPLCRGNELTREEWEQEVPGEEFQALLESGQVPDFCASAVQGFIGEEALIPVLEVHNQRKVRRVIHNERGLVAEFSSDDVIFIKNGKKAPYFGIEVELKDNGTDVDLENISTGLRRMFPELEPGSESKYEKGIRLLD